KADRPDRERDDHTRDATRGSAEHQREETAYGDDGRGRPEGPDDTLLLTESLIHVRNSVLRAPARQADIRSKSRLQLRPRRHLLSEPPPEAAGRPPRGRSG